MALRLATWSPRRLGAFWAGGLLLEAALLLVMFAVLVRPDPPLIARLRGEDLRPARTYTYIVDRSSGAPRPGASAPLRPGPPPAAPEDSFYTVVRWPPGRPLLQGGGHVVALPMRLAWVPALYVGVVPLPLAGLTAAWLWVRRRPPGPAGLGSAGVRRAA